MSGWGVDVAGVVVWSVGVWASAAGVAVQKPPIMSRSWLPTAGPPWDSWGTSAGCPGSGWGGGAVS